MAWDTELNWNHLNLRNDVKLVMAPRWSSHTAWNHLNGYTLTSVIRTLTDWSNSNRALEWEIKDEPKGFTIIMYDNDSRYSEGSWMSPDVNELVFSTLRG